MQCAENLQILAEKAEIDIDRRTGVAIQLRQSLVSLHYFSQGENDMTARQKKATLISKITAETSAVYSPGSGLQRQLATSLAKLPVVALGQLLLVIQTSKEVR